MIEERRSPPSLNIPSYNPQMIGTHARQNPVFLAQRSIGGINKVPGVIRTLAQPIRNPTTIVIVEAPEEKFRFRYASEMSGTHGCIHGKNFDKKNKIFPTIKVENVPDGVNKVLVRVGLYTKTDKNAHHVHKLMMKGVSQRDDKADFIEVETTRDQGFEVVWKGLGIIHTSRTHIESTIFDRKMKVAVEKKKVESRDRFASLSEVEEVKIKDEASKMKKNSEMNNNMVYLGWEAFNVIDGVNYLLCDIIFSAPIRNLKNPRTGDLKITRVSRGSGSVEGQDEVFIFTERVIKEDIKVKFFQVKDENPDSTRLWEADAFFQESDVHHQYAIAFKTPPFADLKVSDSVEVYFELYRPSDEARSQPMNFLYTPAPCQTQNNKRRRYHSNRNHEPSQSLQFRTGLTEQQAISPGPNIHQSESPAPAPTPVPVSPPQVQIQYDLDSQTYQMDFTTIDAVQLCSDASMESQGSQPLPSFGSNSWASMDGSRFTDLSHSFAIPVGGGCIQHDGAARPKVIVPPPSPAPTSPQTLDDIVDTLKSYEKLFRGSKKNKTVEEKITHFLGYTTSDGDNLLHTGVMNGDIDILKYLLNATLTYNCKEFLNEKNKEGDTPLHVAIKTPNKFMTRVLLEAGANPNIKNMEGNAAVHLALIQADSTILTQLLTISRTNPHLNVANNEGLFPFHLAVKTGKLEIVIIMKEQGCDYNIRDRVSGSTPLHLSLRMGHVHITRYLVLKAMVDPEIANFASQSGVELARQMGLLHLLEEAQPNHRICTPEADKILTEWVSEQLSNEDISLNDFMLKDQKILEQHLRPFGRWRLLAEELGLRADIIKDLAGKSDPPSALLTYLKDIDWKVKTLAEALAKILVKDEDL